MHALFFGGKIFICPATDSQATGREKLFTNYNAFSFPWVAIYSKTFKLYLFLRSSIMSTPTKAKRSTWYTAEEKDFFVVMQGEGNSRPLGRLPYFHEKGLQNIASAANCNMTP